MYHSGSIYTEKCMVGVPDNVTTWSCTFCFSICSFDAELSRYKLGQFQKYGLCQMVYLCPVLI